MKVYTIAQVAELAGVSATTVRNAIQAGKLKASKAQGRYQITRESLDEWIAGRRGNGKCHLPGPENSPAPQAGPGEEKAMIPWDYVRGIQDKLHGAIYRAGQSEARVCLLSEEVSRLRMEKDREREKYEARIRYLENLLQEQQRDILERLEAREKIILEFISAWRESAGAMNSKKKRPWWKKVLG